jgi:hypothetical protein
LGRLGVVRELIAFALPFVNASEQFQRILDGSITNAVYDPKTALLKITATGS